MRTRSTAAFALGAVGLVWIGQGLGVLRGSSFMVGDVRWAIAGIVLLAGSAIFGWLALRNRRPV